jgi:transcriptional regulator with GAF, ATPase, and Fis domain
MQGRAGDPPAGAVEPETLARAASVPSPATTLRAVVVEGRDAGLHLVLDRDAPTSVLVGTGPACSLRLGDPTVSRRHFALEPDRQRYRLTDLGSTNGTFVDGVAVSVAFVRGGEVIRCGGTAIRLEEDAAAPATPVTSAMRFGRMLGASPALRRLYPLCERLAAARVPVIIEGETGTGKECLAESLHEVGGAARPFVVFDCTTVSPSLVEAELFGHERGAFTGAIASRPGVFEQAHGGTLFIDEIGELDLALQPKLLRAIDRGEIRRVGGTRSVQVEVRLLAATRRNLDVEVAAGRFRDDLFHRLAIARIELPPLRHRDGDITLLAQHFARQAGATEALSAEVLARFEAYGWPGNVRELRNAISRLVALGSVDVGAAASLQSAHEPARGGDDDAIEAIVASRLPFPLARRRVLDEFERRYVERVLADHEGNVARAASASGIALRYFQIVKARGGKPRP